MTTFPLIRFHQYQSNSAEDELLLFAAPAKAIAAWAGIPRKGWNIRMLYQRWITPSREQEVKDFWKVASSNVGGQGYILGPTALTIAINEPPQIESNAIALRYDSPVNSRLSALEKLKTLATVVLPKVRDRLAEEQRDFLASFSMSPLQDIPDTEHDYVLESALQFTQMAHDPSWFKGFNKLNDKAIDDIVESLEALCHPALVVDGQHRLFGAAQCDNEIWLPVVALPNCKWSEQIYQFVVINEKAQRVETSLLTDIFGSSLTRTEQNGLRSKLERSNVNVEERIAAVISARDARSPFFDMVKLKLEGSPPAGAEPYIPESTIRSLIEGGRATRGWRTDDDFYDYYVSPTFSSRPDWDSWTGGRWREYWFAFWRTVGEFYNQQGKIESPESPSLLWDKKVISNLTKSVTMRLFQRLFIEKAIERGRQVEQSRDLLIDVVGEERAEEEIKSRARLVAIPDTLEGFTASIHEWFLLKGVPVRFFLKAWRNSLDQAQGQVDLWEEMDKAFTFSQEGKRYHTRNVSVFATDEQ